MAVKRLLALRKLIFFLLHHVCFLWQGYAEKPIFPLFRCQMNNFLLGTNLPLTEMSHFEGRQLCSKTKKLQITVTCELEITEMKTLCWQLRAVKEGPRKWSIFRDLQDRRMWWSSSDRKEMHQHAVMWASCCGNPPPVMILAQIILYRVVGLQLCKWHGGLRGWREWKRLTAELMHSQRRLIEEDGDEAGSSLCSGMEASAGGGLDVFLCQHPSNTSYHVLILPPVDEEHAN